LDKREGDASAEPKTTANGKWRLANGEMTVFLEGSIPALPPKNFGRAGARPSSNTQTPNKFGAHQSSSLTTG